MADIDALLSRLEMAKEKFVSEKGHLLEEAAHLTESNIKSFTPRESGRLQDSIKGEVVGTDTIKVSSSVDYAIDVDQGHVQHKRFVPELDKMVHEKFIPGKFMLQKGMYKTQGELGPVIDAWLHSLDIFGG